MNGTTSSSPTYFWTSLYDRLIHGFSAPDNAFDEGANRPRIQPWIVNHPKPKYPGPNSPAQQAHHGPIGGDEPRPIEWSDYELSPVLPGVIAILAAITQKHTAANIADPNLSQEMLAAYTLTLDEEITFWCGNSPFPRWHGLLLAAQLGAIAEAQVAGPRQEELLQVAQTVGMRSLGGSPLQSGQ